jgi:hypothetical protein
MKRNEVSQNETKYRVLLNWETKTKWNETKYNETKRNEMKYHKTNEKYQTKHWKDPKTINEGVKINEILSG